MFAQTINQRVTMTKDLILDQSDQDSLTIKNQTGNKTLIWIKSDTLNIKCATCAYINFYPTASSLSGGGGTVYVDSIYKNATGDSIIWEKNGNRYAVKDSTGGSGTVTSITGGNGLTGGPITTSGTLNVDTAPGNTRITTHYQLNNTDSVGTIVRGTWQGTKLDSLYVNNVVTKLERKTGSDSVFTWKNGTKVFAFKDSIGGGGSDSSIYATRYYAGNTFEEKQKDIFIRFTITDATSSSGYYYSIVHNSTGMTISSTSNISTGRYFIEMLNNLDTANWVADVSAQFVGGDINTPPLVCASNWDNNDQKLYFHLYDPIAFDFFLAGSVVVFIHLRKFN